MTAVAAAVALPLSFGFGWGGTRSSRNGCEQTAQRMYEACRADVFDDFKTTIANCLNVPEDERGECSHDAWQTRGEDRANCGDVREARTDACELLGEDRYDVEPLTDPSLEFVDPDTIGDGTDPNPFFSLEVGHTYVLRGGEGFEETTVVHVTDQTREILGQRCRIVLDAVVLPEEDQGAFDYEAAEVTEDLYAQTTNGDVVYCSEVSRSYEDGVLRSLDGSFEAGLEFAKSGFLIKAAPVVGDAHRQEFALGEAEDLVQYVDTMADVPAEEGGDNPLFPCGGACLKASELAPIEPDQGEFKYYESGLGFVLGVELEDGEPTGVRDELLCAGDSLDVLQDPACQIGDPEALLDVLCSVAPDAFCAD